MAAMKKEDATGAMRPPVNWWTNLDYQNKSLLILNLAGLITILILIIMLGFLSISAMSCDSVQPIETATQFSTTTTLNPTSEESNYAFCLKERNEWMAMPPNVELTDLKLPVSRIIVAHTGGIGCFFEAVCASIVRNIQEQHTKIRNWDDIGWNFLIGGDGNVYEGRGWNKQGAHTKGYNAGTISITIIGSFTKFQPVEGHFHALRALIKRGIDLGKINKNYSMYPQRTFSKGNESPGDNVVNVIKYWPNYKDLNTL